MKDNTSNLSRRGYLGLAGAASVGLAGCLGDDGDPEGGDGGDDPSSESGDEESVTESDVESLIQSWVEYESAAEKEALLHPDSTIRAIDPYYEWSFVKIHEVRGPTDGAVFVHYEQERVEDGIYGQYELELRRHDGEWLAYAEESV